MRFPWSKREPDIDVSDGGDETYDLRLCCHTCRRYWTVRLVKGTSPIRWIDRYPRGYECPGCGVNDVSR